MLQMWKKMPRGRTNMIEEKNYRRIKMLVDTGRWVGPLMYYTQWEWRTGVELLNTYLT